MSTENPRLFIERAQIGDMSDSALETLTLEGPQTEPLNLDKLPTGVVSGTTLIDFSGAPSLAVRAGVSLSMLFASRVASAALKPGDDEDDWLATYTSTLGKLGFSLEGTAIVQSRFKKTGVFVHTAIIPFLTVAFGGAALGPIILAGLNNLKEMDKNSPWITLFDRESRRFNARELHFAAVSSTASESTVRYAIARLDVASDTVNVLFFRVTNATAAFESVTTTMSVNNSLMAVVEPDLRERLARLTRSFIAEAKF